MILKLGNFDYAASLDPETSIFHSAKCEATSRGQQCEACRQVRRTLLNRSPDVSQRDPTLNYSLRKLRIARLRLMAKLSAKADESEHDENRLFAEKFDEGLKKHPEFRGTLAYNVMEAQVNALVSGTWFLFDAFKFR